MELRIVKMIALVALWMGATVGLRAQTVVEYIHTDALGTPVAVTNAAGMVIERSEYEPYGKLVNRPLTDGPGFTGHVQDAATGLTYMQQRYYDPGIGRFLSVDPVTANSGTGANFNRYWYGNNNPYKFTDPDGRFGCTRVPSQSVDCLPDPDRGSPGGPCDLRPCGNSFAAGGDGGPTPKDKPAEQPEDQSLLKGDIFSALEIDLTAIVGPEVSFGQVLDLDTPMDSGVYFSYNTGQGVNVGVALGVGYVVRDIEGKGAAFDINAGKFSPTALIDDRGLNGGMLSIGPGVGISGSTGNTWTLSPNAILRALGLKDD